MSAFGGLVLTNTGRNLLAKAQVGTLLNFTRIAIGDGDLSETPMVDLLNLINQIKTYSITKLKTMTDGKAVIGTNLSNLDVVTGFYWKELGVFAQDPDLGEILYCYGNAGVNAEYIPSGGGPDIIEKSIDIVTLVENAANVTATIVTGTVATTLEPGIVEIAADPSGGIPIATSRVALADDILITSILEQTIASYMPTTKGNFEVRAYLRIQGPVNVVVTISYDDETGPQTKTMVHHRDGLYFPCNLGVLPYAAGSYSLESLFINTKSTSPIVVKVTANVANLVYASTSIVGV